MPGLPNRTQCIYVRTMMLDNFFEASEEEILMWFWMVGRTLLVFADDGIKMGNRTGLPMAFSSFCIVIFFLLFAAELVDNNLCLLIFAILLITHHDWSGLINSFIWNSLFLHFFFVVWKVDIKKWNDVKRFFFYWRQCSIGKRQFFSYKTMKKKRTCLEESIPEHLYYYISMA